MSQDAVSLVSIAVSVVLSLVAILVSFYTFRLQRLETSYSDIDEEYFDLLKLAIQYPSLRDRTRTSTYFELPAADEFRLRYETYAYICWNVMETIFDRQYDKRVEFGVSPTWLPVMIEENRLHYHWYCRNPQLFKAKFRRFVMAELNRVRVSEGTEQDLDAIYTRMLQDFPAEELVSRSQLEHLMAGGQYKLYLAIHATLGTTVGYALMFEPKAPRIAWLDYIAIDSNMRSAGFGGAFLQHICDKLKKTRLGVMLEVEPATSDDPDVRSLQQRRIAFYERSGATRMDIAYLFPAQDEPYPLSLYFKPTGKQEVLPREQIQAMIRSAYDYIHDDVASRHSTLQRFIATVHDHPL